MRQIAGKLYEIMMLILVVLTVMTVWNDVLYNNYINIIVWAVFFVDFMQRLYRAESKWAFIKENPFLVLAIIPFDQFFQTARIVRVIYLFRVKTIAKHYIAPWRDKLTDRSFRGIVILLLAYQLTEAVIILNIEEAVPDLPGALLVVFGQLFFFGRNIFVITDPISVFLLTVTSIIGIIIQGFALQWIFTKSEQWYKKAKQKR